MNLILAIDIGTTHCKAITFDEHCRAVHTISATHTTIDDITGQNEQRPDEIAQQVTNLIQQSLQANAGIGGVCFSAAMHSLIAVDKSGQPLTNAITWADTRSAQQAAAIKRSDVGTVIYEKTGTPVHPMSPLCKIVWLRETMPDIFAKTHKFISIKEYLFYKFFGKYIIDHSIASATGLFDNKKLVWCAEALQVAGITPETLSVPVAVTHIEQELTATYSALFKTDMPLRFITGGNDGCLANLGCGAIATGDAALTIGTSGAVRMTGATVKPDKQQRVFTYLLNEQVYITGGAINNGGIVLEWFDKLFSEESEEPDISRVLQLAATAPAGAGGLLFLPYILGERAPMWDAAAKGTFIGLNNQHTKAHLARAAIEGICFAMRSVVQAIEDTNGSIRNLYASGGFIKSAFWLQLLADILGKKIIVNNSADASATGAAIIGFYATGIMKDINGATTFLKAEAIYEPTQNLQKQYDPLYAIFRSLYPALKEAFEKINEMQRAVV